MDLKRKNGDNDVDAIEKKKKLENCPHAQKCYRRNIHHFKEYHHPHLEEFINKSLDDIKFPSSFVQEKHIYMEQLSVLQQLGKVKPNTTQQSTINTASNVTNTCIAGSNDLPTIIDTTNIASSSTSNLSKPKLIKKTNFIPNTRSLENSNPKNMHERLIKAAPYNLFFTQVPKAVQTMQHENAITFPDLICPSLGKLTSSLQINFMIDIMWLQEQYQVHRLEKIPLTVLYGYEFPKMKEYMEQRMPNVKHHMVQMKDPYGVHHSKVGIYSYEDGSIRVVVSTANLYYEDWNHYNQGLWISPKCPKLEDSQEDYACCGITNFKTNLVNYLKVYNVPILEEWIKRVKRTDFSAVKVFLITSVPGKHYPKDAGCHAHMVGNILSKNCTLPVKTTPQSEGPLSWGVIAQASSIGSLGKHAGEWLRGLVLRSLAAHKATPLTANSNSTLSVVYPCARNVMNSLFGAEGGGCLPYSKAVNEKQKWLHDYLHEWKADHLGRSRAMPHMKSYCRVSPCLSKLAYFLLTSANLSKSAWGNTIQKDFGCYIRSYEVGVMFLPSQFEEDYFTIKSDDKNIKLFPFMYDLPLTPYRPDDEPWCN